MNAEIITLNNVDDYCRLLGTETLHPLVSMVDFADLKSIPHVRKWFGFYCIYYKELECGTIQYGRSRYDYQEGTMLFIGPGQSAGVNDGGETISPKGKVLMFHPDLIKRTPLSSRMKEYTFFSYDTNEGLHLSEREKHTILGCLSEIRAELEHPIDKFTKNIVCSNIELLLNHCVRFYERQFITRELPNHDILSKFEKMLNEYLDSDMPQTHGLPTVQFCAEKVFLSPNYFGDLVKKETGKSPIEMIQLAVVARVKTMLAETDMSISEIAYRCGFNYPHHLNRMFRKLTGLTPLQYRKQAV